MTQKKYFFLLCATIFILTPKAWGFLEDFDELSEYLKGNLVIQEGSYVGRGVTSGDEYQLTLLSFSPQVTSQFVAIFERLDKASIALFSTPESQTQSNLCPFLLSEDRTTLVVPFDQPPQMSLTLHQVERKIMMLELKPLRSDDIFGEVVRFFHGRTAQVLRIPDNAKFQDPSSKDREILIRNDAQGIWADVTFQKDADTSGTYRLSGEGIPGLFVLRKRIYQAYQRQESEEISQVVYFSRRVYASIGRLWFIGGWGRNAYQYITTISTVSKTTWELPKKEK